MSAKIHKSVLPWLSCAWLLASVSVSAQDEPQSSPEPEPQSPLLYIDLPVPIDPQSDQLPQPPTYLDPTEDPAFQRRMEAIDDYNTNIANIEFQGGAWDSDLVEQLRTLGNLQQQQGDHASAVEIFERAMHVNRVNAGLHNLEQVPLIEEMIESYLAMGDWENADLYYNYFYYVQQRAYGPSDPRIIPVLDELAKWHLQAFNIGFGENLGLRLSYAQILFSAAARMVNVHFGRSDERFVELQRSIANSAYLVKTNGTLMTALDTPAVRSSQSLLLAQLNERDQPRIRGFVTGERALLEIVSFFKNQPGSEVQYAEALAQVGDWYLIDERRSAAGEYYTQAWEILDALEDGAEQQQRLFGRVIPIPTFAGPSEELIATMSAGAGSNQAGALRHDYADLVFDVTENGLVRNIRVISEETEENSSQFNRIRRLVRSSYFRPLLVDGERVSSEDNRFRYTYWY